MLRCEQTNPLSSLPRLRTRGAAGICAALFGTLLLLLPLRLQADDAGLRKELQASYERVVKGWKQKDIQAIMAPIAGDYVGVGADGTTEDRAESEDNSKGLLDITKSIQDVSFKIVDLATSGDEATTTLIGRAHSTVADLQGKERTLVYQAVWENTWRKRPEGWRIVQWHELKTRWTLDGNPSDLSELFPGPVAPGEGGDTAVLQEFQGMYARAQRLWKARNLSGVMEQFMAPEYVYKPLTLPLQNRDQATVIIKSWLDNVRSIDRFSFTVDRVSVNGDGVAAYPTWVWVGVVADPQGKTHSWAERLLLRESWKKTAGRWWVIRTEDLDYQVRVDGKLLADPYDPWALPK